jgi:hypothetical protein
MDLSCSIFVKIHSGPKKKLHGAEPLAHFEITNLT